VELTQEADLQEEIIEAEIQLLQILLQVQKPEEVWVMVHLPVLIQHIWMEEVVAVPLTVVLKHQVVLVTLLQQVHHKVMMVVLPQVFMAEAEEDLVVREVPGVQVPQGQEDQQLLVQLMDLQLQELEAEEEQVFLEQDLEAAEAADQPEVLLEVVILHQQAQIQVLDQEEQEDQAPLNLKVRQVMVVQE
jgi:hypothetical protein